VVVRRRATLAPLSAAALSDFARSDADVAATVEDMGDKGFAADGLWGDAQNRLRWPDSLALKPDGTLVFTVTQIDRSCTVPSVARCAPISMVAVVLIASLAIACSAESGGGTDAGTGGGLDTGMQPGADASGGQGGGAGQGGAGGTGGSGGAGAVDPGPGPDGGGPDGGGPEAAGNVDGPRPDTAGADMSSCVGKPDPTTAKDPLRFHGTVVSYDQMPLGGVTVRVLRLNNNAQLGMVQTAADGTFSVDVPSGGKPVSAYLTFSLAGYVNTSFFQADAFAEDPNFPIAVFTSSQLGFLYMFSGSGISYDPARGTVAQGVVDCNGNPVEGATLSFSPAAAKIVYQSGDRTPMYRQSTTYANGFGLGLGLPAMANGQPIQVGATAMGKAFKSYTARTYPGQLTVTVVHP